MADFYNNDEGNIFSNDQQQRHHRGRHRSSDSDGLPGGTENSKAYDRLYNPQGENEYTNLPENANQIEALHLLQTHNNYVRNRLRGGLGDALRRVQYWPYAGRFIIPKENTYAAHLALVRQGNTVDIHFDPKTYLYFDKVIAEEAKRPELFDPRHKDYPKYQTLRENLAVFRNDLMGIYMEDGSFDPGDEKYFPKFVQIANEIGDALRVGNSPDKIIFPSLDPNLLNIEGEGAAALYSFIHNKQIPNTILGNVVGYVRRVLGQPDNQWGLPPIENTAFSEENLLAPPPRSDELCQCSPSQLHQRCAELAADQKAADPASNAVDAIEQHERIEAVNHGHTILDWLRNIQFTDKSLESLTMGQPGENDAEVQKITQLLDAYYDIADTALRQNPNLYNSASIQQANEVADSMEYALELMAKLEKPKSLADTMQISTDETQQPEKWHQMCKQTVSRLMETLKGGLEEMVGTLEQQAHDHAQQAEEMADRHVELALANHAAFTKGRRRRRRQTSGQGAAKQKKVDQAIRADDYALGEGAHIGRSDISRDGIVDSLQKPQNSFRNPVQEAQQAAKASMNAALAQQLQQQASAQMDATIAPPTINAPASMDFSRIKGLDAIGKDLLKMQKDSDAAAANIPEVQPKSITEQTNTQRVADAKIKSSKRPKTV